MSQLNDGPNPLALADSHLPSRPNADSRPPTSILPRSDTKINITSHQISAIDITESFTAASSALNTGQLVKDEYFTLFEAVGALEIMDSKMDSGHLAPGETLEDEYNVLRNLLPEEVIGIMDQILCHEVAWHIGHPLSQTLFTCLYVERLLWPEPKTLEEAQFSRDLNSRSDNPLLNRVLRSYCIATIKACHFVHCMVTGESYYEEEDFTSQLYHRELLPKVSIAEIQTLLDEALSYNDTASISPESKKAIEKRLQFRRSILDALEQDTFPLNAGRTPSLSCIPLLQDIKASSQLGKPVNEAFSTKIQRTLASSVPPRPMVTIKLSDALAHFETLCNDATDVGQILATKTSEELSTAIWVFMSRIPQPSVYIRALVQSFLLDRETQRVLGKTTTKQFLFSSIAAIVLPKSPILEAANDMVESATSPRFQMARLLAEFDGKAGQQYINIFRNACLNRCRTRRTLCHLVLDWDTLQADAEDIDGTLQTYTKEKPALYASHQPTYSYPLSSWVYHHKLNHLRQIIQMGFELSIYAPDEISGMYWFLSYICATHISHIDRISFFLERDMLAQEALSQNSDAPEKPDVKDQADYQKTLKSLFRIYTHLKATDAFSKALHALHTLLLRHKTIEVPQRPYSSDKLRYELRMKPFLSLNVPEPVTFESFREESSCTALSDEEVLEEARMRIGDAKKFWEEVLKAGWSAELAENPELNRSSKEGKTGKTEMQKGSTTIEGEWSEGVKNVIRACIATSISIVTLKKRLDETGGLKGMKVMVPVPGEKGCWHEWWIVPRVLTV
ncbi:hypothetical protein EPUS_04443 [Endocarpon pusillum Z07020]|uniref:Amino-acid N-acetyltransferase subunit Mak10 n=1 Tax=Endocarpon pusillum (strain Z07020 / HMAS-L-300199) TaxID=1263415 RepID=U1GVY8_ENDPU|nr:uncharacterized protein EPUS_04443 [Endocarpon pusillum Z07020]ERF76623.1 hypothetical protein EPUS_04443 [Endocarpon pusillum Z07020]